MVTFTSAAEAGLQESNSRARLKACSTLSSLHRFQADPLPAQPTVRRRPHCASIAVDEAIACLTDRNPWEEPVNYRKAFVVEPGTRVKLSEVDPAYQGEAHLAKHAEAETEDCCHQLSKLQYLMYSEGKHSLLVVLQAMDAGGKDGTVRHAIGAMNPQGATVAAFKQPSPEELKHDFLWRVHPHAPGKGKVAVFNRSHYEDVLVVRVHNLVPTEVWSSRYADINALRSFFTARTTPAS